MICTVALIVAGRIISAPDIADAALSVLGGHMPPRMPAPPSFLQTVAYILLLAFLTFVCMAGLHFLHGEKRRRRARRDGS